MAAVSSSLTNFLSFLTPSKPPSQSISPPPNHLHLSQTHKPRPLHITSSNAYNVQVLVDENEPEERLIGRFKREVMRAGIIQEVRRRRYFENSQAEKKRRVRDAAKRNKRRRPFTRPPFQNRQDAPEQKKSDEDEDNWDLPQGDIPY